MKIDVKSPKHWLLLMLQCLYTGIVILIRPLCKKPDVPIAVLYGHQFAGNLRALYLEWEKQQSEQITLYYLTLDPDQAATLEHQDVRTLRCSRLRDMMVLGRATAVVSDHGLHLMHPLVRFTDLLFIDVWHGIPFKGFVPEDFRLQQRYDEVWVSSDRLNRLYVEQFGFEPSRVRTLGYARTDRLFASDVSANSFKQAMGLPLEKKIALYAPTWQQDDSGRELFPFHQEGRAFIEALGQVCRNNNATLVVRSHLNSDITAVNLPDVLFCPQSAYPDTEAILEVSDILICDWSSIAFDFLTLGRPTLFLDVPPPFRNGFSLGEEYRFGKIIGDMTALTDTLSRYLAEPGHYTADCGVLRQEIEDELYDPATKGKAAALQLSRLIEMSTVN